MQRPDLSNLHPDVISYIEYLEKKLKIQPEPNVDILSVEKQNEILPSEPETTFNVITISQRGCAKRTFRHLFSRQHRSGMGVFDLDTSAGDYPSILGIADENQTLLVLTNKAKAYRIPLHQIEQTPVRDKGNRPFERLNLDPEETVAAVLPEQARGYVALLGQSGRVRCLRHHLFGEHMRPGTVLFNTAEFGNLTSACWTPGDAELFIVTEQGMGIRFAEKAISPQGDSGIRTGAEDRAIGITSVFDDSQVFLLGADGRGTVRSMSGFAANKSAGGAGKIAMKTNRLVGAVSVLPNDDLWIITRQGKMIRFKADEIPSTDAAVQGVICISMRADEVSAFTRSGSEG